MAEEGTSAELLEAVREVQAAGDEVVHCCPKCKQYDGNLSFAAEVWARIYQDGTDSSDSDTEWTGGSKAQCDCGWEGTVKDTEVAAEALNAEAAA